ncbi:MAG: hypothetical protein PVF12_09130 [Thiohalocapsa sp.]
MTIDMAGCRRGPSESHRLLVAAAEKVTLIVTLGRNAKRRLHAYYGLDIPETLLERLLERAAAKGGYEACERPARVAVRGSARKRLIPAMAKRGQAPPATGQGE